MSMTRFTLIVALIAAIGLLLPQIAPNPYLFYAGFIVLQYVVIATGWNILGGYAGYINFGTSGFFGGGAYLATFMIKAFDAPLIVQIFAAMVLGCVLGLALGYLTLRIQGIYFAIATIALVVVLETAVHNISYLGGAAGVAVVPQPVHAWFKGNTQYVFCMMLILACASIVVARWIETSWVGRGLRAIRASEPAAEACGVPTLRMKLLACGVSGAIMAAAGSLYPLYALYVDPVSAFSLTIALNALAMPLIGGTSTWLGPVIGAVLLASVQQITTVTIESKYNVLVVGLVLIAFVIVAPQGLLGLRKGGAK
jgi:branched-chain amino acid transport system permease protein